MDKNNNQPIEEQITRFLSGEGSEQENEAMLDRLEANEEKMM